MLQCSVNSQRPNPILLVWMILTVQCTIPHGTSVSRKPSSDSRLTPTILTTTTVLSHLFTCSQELSLVVSRCTMLSSRVSGLCEPLRKKRRFARSSILTKRSLVVTCNLVKCSTCSTLAQAIFVFTSQDLVPSVFLRSMVNGPTLAILSSGGCIRSAICLTLIHLTSVNGQKSQPRRKISPLIQHTRLAVVSLRGRPRNGQGSTRILMPIYLSLSVAGLCKKVLISLRTQCPLLSKPGLTCS